MDYTKESLQKNYEDNSDGLSPVEFFKSRCALLLEMWIEHDNGRNFYKNTGPYWENLLEILEKYSPDLFSKFVLKVGPFDITNDDVREAYDYGSDLLNLMAALACMSIRDAAYSKPDEPHIIELNGEEIPYEPNRFLDYNQYFGRD